MCKYGFLKHSLVDYPGEVCSVVFMAGCNFHCPYCHNANLATTIETAGWALNEIVDYLVEAKSLITAVCISGGEPTLQQNLPKLTKAIHELGLGVISFTGHLYEQVQEQLFGCDMVLDGAFDETKLETERKILGSMNQRILCLTDRYKDCVDWFLSPTTKSIEINVGSTIFANGDKI